MQTPVNITRIPRGEFVALIESSDAPKAAKFAEQLPREFLADTRELSIVTAPTEPVPDCQQCGVCCSVPTFIGITQSECERLGDAVEVTLPIRDDIVIERFLQKSEITGHCLHLDGVLGVSVTCSIYNDRPAVCGQFEAGSDKCHEFRRMCGIEPQLTKDQLAAAISAIDSGRNKGNEIEQSEITEDYGFLKKLLWILGYKFKSKLNLKIIAYLRDDSAHVIHRYQPDEETWYESDFWGMTLDAARSMVGERKKDIGKK
ncbi:MAG TPA: YkgJ family cysteine cluster protein [Pyrinomonadaceae bacterium]|jgi:hypothetical protein